MNMPGLLADHPPCMRQSARDVGDRADASFSPFIADLKPEHPFGDHHEFVLVRMRVQGWAGTRCVHGYERGHRTVGFLAAHLEHHGATERICHSCAAIGFYENATCFHRALPSPGHATVSHVGGSRLAGRICLRHGGGRFTNRLARLVARRRFVELKVDQRRGRGPAYAGVPSSLTRG